MDLYLVPDKNSRNKLRPHRKPDGVKKYAKLASVLKSHE